MDQEKWKVFWKRLRFGSHSFSYRKRQEEGVTPINLSKKASERVVQTDQEVLVQRLDETSGQWITEYKLSKMAPINYKVISGFLHAARKNVVVIAYWMGNGGYLTYFIIGRLKGKVVKLAGNDDLYKGDIFFEEGKLLEKRDSRYSEWKVKDGRLALTPFTIPPIPGALRIEYSILSDGSVMIEQDHYKVPVGTIVQFIRSDNSSLLEKGFIYGKDNEQDLELFEYLPEYKNAIRINKKGIVEVKIAPDLDWAKAFIITIEAE